MAVSRLLQEMIEWSQQVYEDFLEAENALAQQREEDYIFRFQDQLLLPVSAPLYKDRRIARREKSLNGEQCLTSSQRKAHGLERKLRSLVRQTKRAYLLYDLDDDYDGMCGVELG